jgi:ATP-dependent DNA helicase RecG
MAINISNISSSQKNLLLSKQEGHFLDFKSIDIKPANITKHIAAFANADGGELYIGIDENKNTDTR